MLAMHGARDDDLRPATATARNKQMINPFTLPILLGESLMPPPPRIDLSRPVVNPRKKATKDRSKVKKARKQKSKK